MARSVIAERAGTMKELEDCILRRAESMGLEGHSEEFESLIMEKIIKPENRMMQSVRSDNVGKNISLKPDYYLAAMELKYNHRKKLRYLAKWAKLNHGISISSAERIIGTDRGSIEKLGREAMEFGLGDFCKDHITGEDDCTSYGVHPELMSDGNRQL